MGRLLTTLHSLQATARARFARACAVMDGRLTIFHKMAVFAIVMIAPLALMAHFYLRQADIAIRFTEKQIAGVKIAREVWPTLAYVGLGAERAKPNAFDVKRARVLQAVADTTSWFDMRQSAQTLIDAIALAKSKHDGAVTLRALSRGRDFLTDLADQSGLILDPQLETYHLISLTLITAPDLLHAGASLAQTVNAGAPSSTDSQRMMQVGRIQQLITEMEQTTRRVMRYRGNKDLDGNLSALVTSLRASVAPMAAAASTSTRASRTLQEATLDVNRVVFRVNAIVNDLWRVAADGLQRELTARLERLSGERGWTLIASLWALLAALSLSLGVARSVIEPQRKLRAGMKAIVDGDLRITIPFKGYQNEIGETARAVETFRQAMIERAMLEADYEHQQRELERRVFERTGEAHAARVRAEQAQEQLQLAMRTARAGVWSFNANTHETYSAPEIEDLFGAPVLAEDVRRGVWRCFHPDDQAVAQAAAMRSVATRSHHEVEARVVNPGTGAVRWARVTTSWTPEGVIVGCIQDITDRKHQEEALTAAKSQLEEKTRTLSLALESSRAGVWMMDRKRGLVWSSPELEKLTGSPFSLEHLVDGVPSNTHPDDVPLLRNAVMTAIRTGTFEVEYRIVTPSGDLMWVRSVATYEDGRFTGFVQDATARKERDLQLRDALASLSTTQDILSLALNAIQACVWRIDFDTGDVWASPQVEAQFGCAFSRENFEDGVWRLVHPDDADTVRRLNRVVQDQREIDYDVRFLMPDDSVRWVKVVGRFVRGNQLIGVFQDITERKVQEMAIVKAYADLAERDHTLRLALSATRAGVWTYDERMGRAWSSPEFRSVCGTDFIKDDLEDGYWRHVHPDDREHMRTHMARAREELHFEFDCRIMRPDGAPVWVRSAGVSDGNGRTIGLIVDIDERKRQEIAIAKANADLAERDRTLRLALRASRSGVWTIDLVGRTVWSSPEFADIAGEPLTLKSLREDSWARIHPEDVALARDQMASAVNTGAMDFEHRVLRPDGSVVWVRACANVSKTRIVGLISDITDRKLQELELMRARAEAEAANRAKSVFLATMSHEIRTPLNGVIGMAGALSRTPLTAAQKEMLRVINSSGELLLQLLNDVLDLSKIESGQMTLESVPFDLETVVQDICLLHSRTAMEKGLSFAMEFDSALPRQRLGDPTRLSQILQNLISNAVKFTHEGGVVVTVRAVDPDGRTIAVEVRDTGIGMDEIELGRLFQRFSQADGSIARRFGGSGLGLAIAQDLAGLMGGAISAHSQKQKGTTFTATLAIDFDEEAQAGGADAADSMAIIALDVLAVDDNETNRLVLRTVMEQVGVQVELAVDGRDAIQAARARTYDLILMDVHMPLLSGIEAARMIRADGPNATTPIIALTADTSPDTIAACRAAGMNAHCEKPISPSRLLGVIQAVLEQAAAPPTTEAEGKRA